MRRNVGIQEVRHKWALALRKKVRSRGENRVSKRTGEQLRPCKFHLPQNGAGIRAEDRSEPPVGEGGDNGSAMGKEGPRTSLRTLSSGVEGHAPGKNTGTPGRTLGERPGQRSCEYDSRDRAPSDKGQSEGGGTNGRAGRGGGGESCTQRWQPGLEPCTAMGNLGQWSWLEELAERGRGLRPP